MDSVFILIIIFDTDFYVILTKLDGYIKIREDFRISFKEFFRQKKHNKLK